MNNYIKEYIKKSIQAKTEISNDENFINLIKSCAEVIITSYKNNKKVLVAGNGGSAADSQHIVAELVSKFCYERKALNAIALTTNTSILTAIGNDFSNDYIFSRQIEAYGNRDDVFIAISTSGNSKNILYAIEQAKSQGLIVIGLTGKNESEMDGVCDYLIKVPSNRTSIIQESHIMIGHIICGLVEEKLFNEFEK